MDFIGRNTEESILGTKTITHDDMDIVTRKKN